MSGPAAPAAAPATVRDGVLSLGSNLGDREATLRDAIAALALVPGVDVTAASGLVQTPALKLQGVDLEAPSYLNAAVAIRTGLDPLDLLDAINTIERDHGRVRLERWGDRTLDIDIVVLGDLERADDRLTLPHPRASERGFVLVPWLQLDADAVLPGHGRVDALPAATADDVRPFVAEALL